VTWRFLAENPVSGLKLPEGKPVSRAQVLSPAQLSLLIDHLQSPAREMVLLAASTGVRPSELFGLQWQDLDSVRQVIHIRRRVYRRHVGETKTCQSVRTIPVMAEVLAVLLAQQGQPDAFIFHGARGGYLRPDEVFHRHILPVAQSLGLPPFTWRSFRRSAETLWHNSGVSLKTQQSLLGHCNPNTTLLYAESDEAGQRAASQLICSKLSQIHASVTTDRPA